MKCINYINFCKLQKRPTRLPVLSISLRTIGIPILTDICIGAKTLLMYNCFDTFPDCNHINNITCKIYTLMHFITLIRISVFSKQTTNCIAFHADNSRIICASTLSHWSCILTTKGSLILNASDTYYQLFLILKKTVAQTSDSKLDVPIKFDMTCPDCS